MIKLFRMQRRPNPGKGFVSPNAKDASEYAQFNWMPHLRVPLRREEHTKLRIMGMQSASTIKGLEECSRLRS